MPSIQLQSHTASYGISGQTAGARIGSSQVKPQSSVFDAQVGVHGNSQDLHGPHVKPMLNTGRSPGPLQQRYVSHGVEGESRIDTSSISEQSRAVSADSRHSQTKALVPNSLCVASSSSANKSSAAPATIVPRPNAPKDIGKPTLDVSGKGVFMQQGAHMEGRTTSPIKREVDSSLTTFKVQQIVDTRFGKALEMLTMLSEACEERWKKIEKDRLEKDAALQQLRQELDAQRSGMTSSSASGTAGPEMVTSLGGLRNDLDVLRSQLRVIASQKEQQQTLEIAVEDLRNNLSSSLSQSFNFDIAELKDHLAKLEREVSELRSSTPSQMTSDGLVSPDRRNLENMLHQQQKEVAKVQQDVAELRELGSLIEAVEIEREVRAREISELNALAQKQQEETKMLAQTTMHKAELETLMAVERDARAELLQHVEKTFRDLENQHSTHLQPEQMRQHVESYLREHRLGELQARSQSPKNACLQGALKEEMQILQQRLDELALESNNKLQHAFDRLVSLEGALLRAPATPADEIFRHVNDQLDAHCKLLLQRCEDISVGDKSVLRAELAARSKSMEALGVNLQGEQERCAGQIEELQQQLKTLMDSVSKVSGLGASQSDSTKLQLNIESLQQSVDSLTSDLQVSKAELKGQLQHIAAEMMKTSEVTMQAQASMAQTEQYMTESLSETYKNFEFRVADLKRSLPDEQDDSHSSMKVTPQIVETLQVQLQSLSDKISELDETRTLSTAGLPENIKSLIEERIVEYRKVEEASRQNVELKVQEVTHHLARVEEAAQQTQALPDQMGQHTLGFAALQSDVGACSRAVDKLALDVQTEQDARASEYLDLRTSIQRLTSKIAQVEALAAYSPDQLVQKVEKSLGELRSEMDIKFTKLDNDVGDASGKALDLRTEVARLRENIDGLLATDCSRSIHDQGRLSEQSSAASTAPSAKRVQRQIEDMSAKLERLEREFSLRTKLFKAQPTSGGEFALQANVNAQTEALEAEVTKQHTLISELHMRLAQEIADVTHRIEAQREEVSQAIEVKLEAVRSGISPTRKQDGRNQAKTAPLAILNQDAPQFQTDENPNDSRNTRWSSLFG